MNKQQQIEEMTQDFINFGITTRQGVESFAEALYNAGYCQIDENCAVITKAELKEYKRQAVKEFAEKLKNQIAIYCRYGYVDYDDTTDVIDELLKEFLK